MITFQQNFSFSTNFCLILPILFLPDLYVNFLPVSPSVLSFLPVQPCFLQLLHSTVLPTCLSLVLFSLFQRKVHSSAHVIANYLKFHELKRKQNVKVPLVPQRLRLKPVELISPKALTVVPCQSSRSFCIPGFLCSK